VMPRNAGAAPTQKGESVRMSTSQPRATKTVIKRMDPKTELTRVSGTRGRKVKVADAEDSPFLARQILWSFGYLALAVCMCLDGLTVYFAK